MAMLYGKADTARPPEHRRLFRYLFYWSWHSIHMDVAIFSALALLLYLALLVWTTCRLWASDRYDRAQKVGRSAMLLLLPVVGEILVRHALSPPAYIPHSMPTGLFSGLWAAPPVVGDPGWSSSGAMSPYVGDGGGFHGGGGFDCGSGGSDGGACGGGHSG